MLLIRNGVKRGAVTIGVQSVRPGWRCHRSREALHAP